MRVGIGYDIHPLVPGRKLIVGGIEIPHSKGLDGHSDADVLTHAVCRVVNVDAVINAQAPRLGPHLSAMKGALAKAMGVEPARINIKVKSGEGQGAVGREEAMTAQAVCLIEGM